MTVRSLCLACWIVGSNCGARTGRVDVECAALLPCICGCIFPADIDLDIAAVACCCVVCGVSCWSEDLAAVADLNCCTVVVTAYSLTDIDGLSQESTSIRQ